jgi:hypothetical protein
MKTVFLVLYILSCLNGTEIKTKDKPDISQAYSANDKESLETIMFGENSIEKDRVIVLLTEQEREWIKLLVTRGLSSKKNRSRPMSALWD